MTLDHNTEARQNPARCAVCQIERCANCDTVHRHVSHASLRLTMAAFLSLCASLLEAAQTATQNAIVPAAPRRTAN